MILLRMPHRTAIALIAAFLLLSGTAMARAQAALLMEEPYGFFGTLNPTGHNALYFQRICAETPISLRRCQPGELGVVIARYQGISGYDWIAVPLIPYLYSVQDVEDVPVHVDRAMVRRMRDRYHEAHLLSLGDDLSAGGFMYGGWTELLGASYQRRIFAFRFVTTKEQDDGLIQRLNAAPNLSHFDLLSNNCADFARKVLNQYFPGSFSRNLFPDAGVTTPKQIAHKLVRYARKHPETQLTIFEIPQIPGYRHHSGSNKGVDESLATSAYAIPIVLASPYLAVGLTIDYLVRGRFKLLPKRPYILSPQTMTVLAHPSLPMPNLPDSVAAANSGPAEQPEETDFRVPGTAGLVSTDAGSTKTKESSLQESKVSHE